MSPINRFLLDHNLRIVSNPCISPDFCLDWQALSHELLSGKIHRYEKSRFETAHGFWELVENSLGDCAWWLESRQESGAPLESGIEVSKGIFAYPATFENLLQLKNFIQEHDPDSTIFPTTSQNLGRSTLGIGARFTTLHWPAVDWAMAALGIGMTANQNSIPRELVYDVDAMLENRLDTVPFPFIGANVPEGHQGQSVEGMSHGCILTKLKTGFHRLRLAWSFNADHQPIGGKFDAREDALVRGCLLASYITFDLSPELAQTAIPEDPAAWIRSAVPEDLVTAVRTRVAAAGLTLQDTDFSKLLATVWPAIQKMKRRDEKYTTARARVFTTPIGRAYLRELSIDELPGITAPATTAVMLALCEKLGMKIHFVAPAFGFQKNMPYPDNTALRALIEAQWEVCRQFDVSIGFHSGSGKSAENYRVMGEVTGRRLEIKTSGRYTYEMGRALAASSNPSDRVLWDDWYSFTVELAVQGAFSPDETERRMARSFITDALTKGGCSADVFSDGASTRAAISKLPVSPEHMFWFEYNFLYVLAAGGSSEKSALGDHSAAGYEQRRRFYTISDEARLCYAKNAASYILFLAEATGLSSAEKCQAAKSRLEGYNTFQSMVADIS